MKTDSKLHSGGESCSCTNCLYKSESEHPSVTRFISQGSRIDRLYYGKYIPLRERKLLKRLVRTRAVYDDIRAQLISDSTFSLSTKGADDAENSSGAILELVDRVDKGATLGSNKLSECCSCCSCSSKVDVHEHSYKHRKKALFARTRQHMHARGQLGETYHRKKGVRFKAKHIWSDPCTCTLKFSGLFKKRSKLIFKKIRPTSTEPFFDFQPTIDDEIVPRREKIRAFARTSYENIKKANMHMKDKMLGGINKLKESQTKLHEKLQLETKKSLNKLTTLKDNLTTKIKVSAQKIKRKPKHTFVPSEEIALQIKKDSLIKFKEDLKRKQILKDWACEPTCDEDICIPEECFIKLQQKKLHQGKPRKRQHRGVTRYEIVTQERKIGGPLNRSHIRIQTQKRVVESGSEIKEQKPVLRTEQTQNIVGQNVSFNIGPKRKDTQVVDTKKVENKPTTLKSKVDENEKLTVIKSKTVNLKPKKIKKQKTNVTKKSSQYQAVRIGSSFSFNVEFYKNKPDLNKSVQNLRTDAALKPHSGIDYNFRKPTKVKKNKAITRRQHGSQVMIPKSLKDTQTEKSAMDRCFCTLKLKAKKTRSKIGRSLTRRVRTTERSVMTLNSAVFPCNLDCTPDDYCNVLECNRKLKNMQTNTEYKNNRLLYNKLTLLPYECEPGVCTPGYCDPYQCIKLINMREKKRKNCSVECVLLNASRKIKSTSSLASKYNTPSRAKYVQSMITNQKGVKNRLEKKRLQRGHIRGDSGSRNAVRIGSTFSFNIEFYKGNPYPTQQSTELNTFTIKPKAQIYQKQNLKQSGIQSSVINVRKNIPTQIYKKKNNAHIGTALKRCFCTLKLQKQHVPKKIRQNTLHIGTETIEPDFLTVYTANKGTKTKQKYSRILEPFECEPYLCVPGECNPYQCLEKINKRNIRLKEVALDAIRPDMASRSSDASSGSHKSVLIQSKPKYKERKVLVKDIKPKKFQGIKSDHHYLSSKKSKQAVKIGSTFSFNIEFYKNKPVQKQKHSYSRENIYKISTKRGARDRGIKIIKLNDAHVDTQMQKTKKRHKGSMVSPLLKRCFCTLNLQKKWKKEAVVAASVVTSYPFSRKIYAVNRVITTENEYNKFLYNTYRTNIVDQTSQIDLCKNIHVVPQLKDFYESMTNNKQLDIHPKQYLRNITSSQMKTYKPVKKKSEINKSCVILQSSKQYIESKTCKYAVVKYNSGSTNNAMLIGDACLQSQQIKKKQITGLTRYFRRCFCTMNFKIENTMSSKKRNTNAYNKINNNVYHTSRKLKPYECEPGICVPGECDPYECQKVISKRLQRAHSKKSGAEYTSKSISSSASQLPPKYRSKKQQQSSVERSNQSHNYKEIPKGGHRQAVRVGSSFSFDLEFSKNLTPKNGSVYPKHSFDTYSVKPMSKSKGIKERKRHLYHGQSQTSLFETAHKDSSTMPIKKRCFCTLKLQKKGKLHKEFKKKRKMLTAGKLIDEVKSVSRGQNTVHFKPFKTLVSLSPYECEPNICIPGRCDPYQCLEIMNRRRYNRHLKDIGTESPLHSAKSVSSMTSSSKIRYKTRALNVKSKKPKSKPVTSRQYYKTSVQKPQRQAVRVGSSFSFNIEFFKDHPNAKQIKYKENYTDHSKHLPRLRKHKKMRQRFSQGSSNLHHKQSQDENFLQTASTLTESFKRCFCTYRFFKSGRKNLVSHYKPPKIRKMDIKNTQQIQPYCKPGICVPNTCKPEICEEKLRKTNNFIKRCFCLLSRQKKKINVHRNERTGHEKLREVTTRSVTTKVNSALRSHALLPYECKPNICIPGQCNPYECEKLIKLRNKNNFYRDFGISTTVPMKYTVGSITDRYKNPKRKTRSTLYKDNLKYAKRNNFQVSHKLKFPQSRQSVKLGSTFSFNIEFYKHKKFDGIEFEKLPKQKAIKSKRHKFDTISGNNHHKTRNVPSGKKKYTNQSQVGTQLMSTQSTMTAMPPSKRCFCTLDLKRPKIEKPIQILQSSVSTETDKYISPEHPALNLLPYECEPGVCVPGECDPYECFDLMKKRRNIYRSSGTSPKHLQKRNAIAVANKDNNKTKNKKFQYTDRSMKSSSTTQLVQQRQRIKRKDSTGSFKQAIRIGSNFDFNIEFYKNNSSNIDKVKKKKHNNLSEQTLFLPRKQNLNRKVIPINSKIVNVKQNKKFQSRALQSARLKYDSKSSAVDPFLKRCFCTLKLQKRPANIIAKTILSDNLPKKENLHVMTRNKSTATLKNNTRMRQLSPYECEPFFCVPDECDPYLCAERIKIRDRSKLRSTKTQVAKTWSQKNVFAKPDNFKLRRVQANLKEPYLISTSQQSRIVEVPRFSNMLNKQAVTIGSNFSFNVEFYKEIIPKSTITKSKYSRSDKKVIESSYGKKLKGYKPKRSFMSNQTNITNLRSCGSQGDCTKSKEKISGANNVLKRCFCTLKLQNKFKTNNDNPPNNILRFPQTIEVRKATIQQNPKMLPKQTTNSETQKRKSDFTLVPNKIQFPRALAERSIQQGRKIQPEQTYTNLNKNKLNIRKQNILHVHNKIKFPQSIEVRRAAVHQKPKIIRKVTYTEVKSVSTRINKKNFNKPENFEVECNPYFCRGGKAMISKDMKTILPYRPTKFNKVGSKTLIPVKRDKFPRQTLHNRSKKVCRKKSDRHLALAGQSLIAEENTLNQNILIKILRGFACFFLPKRNESKNPDVVDDMKTQNLVNDNTTSQKYKDFENLKLSKSERQTRPTSKMFISKSKSVKLGYKRDRESTKCKDTCPYYFNNQKSKYLRYQCGDTAASKQPTMSLKINQSPKPRKPQYVEQNNKENVLCEHCLMKGPDAYKIRNPSPGLRVHFVEVDTFNNNLAVEGSNVKKFKKLGHKETKYGNESQFCKYCYSCGKKINKDEFKKAAGDQIDAIKQRLLEKFKKKKDDNICSGGVNREEPSKPLFEVYLNSDSHEIINREEVIDNVKKLKTKSKSKGQYESATHQKSCPCCICLAKRNKTGAKLTVTAKGSKVGKAINKILFRPKKRNRTPIARKPCTCGSVKCQKAMKKMTKQPEKKNLWSNCVCSSPICEIESAKIRAMQEKLRKKEEKERKLRLKKYQRDDFIRRKLRLKEGKEIEKKINKNASDVVLLAESVLDIGRWGITACADLLRMLTRTAKDPKNAYRTLKAMKQNPNLISDHLLSGIQGTGATGTLKRIRLRCLSMKGVRTVRNVLESNRITNYLLYIGSKDPKRRMVKPKRVRERFDFACSLYMGTLRKRPYLAVHDICPWFYPHFLSLVNVWKQFTDIMLFLLAVVVWSPCILGMELCRAMLCCFLCTG